MGFYTSLRENQAKNLSKRKNKTSFFKKLKLSFLEIKAIILKKERYDFALMKFNYLQYNQQTST